MTSRIAAISCLAVSLAAGQDSAGARSARHSPGFLRQSVIYQVWMRSFTPEGTLKAAEAKLPHIAGLGANLIYLSPLMLQSKQGGYSNPYRISDYDRIDPEYGSEADLRSFVQAAHKLGLKVLMDIVYYHTAPDSVLLQHPAWYRHTADGTIELGRWRLPRPDFANAELRRYLIGNLVHWAKDVGVDGFRCDVAAGIPLDFWEQARRELDKVNPDLVMLAESDLPEEQISAFDISYNFPWYEALLAVVRDGEPATRLRQQWETMRKRFPVGGRFLRLNDNHDRDRADVVFGQKGAVATTVLDFALDGIPFIYNGLEIGDATPTNHQAHVAIRWDNARRFADRQRLIQRLCALRKAESALNAGDVVWIDNSEPASVASFLRKKGDEEILAVVNLSNRKLDGFLDLPIAEYDSMQDLLHDKRVGFSMAPGRVPFSLGSFEFMLLKRPRR
jgi:glycosidase